MERSVRKQREVDTIDEDMLLGLPYIFVINIKVLNGIYFLLKEREDYRTQDMQIIEDNSRLDYLGIFNVYTPDQFIRIIIDYYNRNILPSNLCHFFEKFDCFIIKMLKSRCRFEFKKYYHEMVNFCISEEGGNLAIGKFGKTLQTFWSNYGIHTDREHKDFNLLLYNDAYISYMSDELCVPIQIASLCANYILQYRTDLYVGGEGYKGQCLRMISEIYAEHFNIEIMARTLKIESGQNLLKTRMLKRTFNELKEKIEKGDDSVYTEYMEVNKKLVNRIKINSDSHFFLNELTIILARTAKYNIDSRRFNRTMSELGRLEDIGKEEEISLSHCIQFPQNMRVIIDGREHSLQQGNMILRGPRNVAEKTYMHVSINDLLRYVENATEQRGQMLTIQETLKAIRNGGSLDRKVAEVGPEYLDKIGRIITPDMVDGASNESICVNGTTEVHQVLEPKEVRAIRRGVGRQ